MTNTERYPQVTQTAKENMISVWDPFVRLFHWLMVGAFFTAYLSEEDFLTIHIWAGYTVTGLLLLRLIWGVIGTKHARFTDFVYPPKHILQFLKETLSLKAKRYIGHNPAGGAMVVLLLVSLMITALSGLILLGVEEAQGPLAPWLSGASHSLGDLLEELHEFFANFTVFLVFIHIAGVLVESLIHRENLTASMFSGNKRSDSTTE